MTTKPILINGQWTQDTSTQTITPVNPGTGESLNRRYPISTQKTLRSLAQHAANAAETLNQADPQQIASFLEAQAALTEERREEIASCTHDETGLPLTPRLRETEMDRTIDQLRQAARCVRERNWMCARIDTERDLRSMYEPLGGAVLTIGPNNFPLAYNAIAGGDYAAAIAARNPVIAKAHPLHPETTRLLAECASEAAQKSGLPPGSVQMFYHCDPDDGLELIRMNQVSAVGFTGSRRVGLQLKEAGDKTGTPVYLELSSINPMFLLPGAVMERHSEIADMIADSILAASGQQCTCPGLIVLPVDAQGNELVNRLTQRLNDAEPQVMLSADGVKGLHESIKHVQENGAELLIGGKPISSAHAKHENTLLRIDAKSYLSKPNELQHEMFGVSALVITCEHDEQFIEIASTLKGNLTGTIHQSAQGHDQDLLSRVSRVLRTRVGRLIHDSVPTGVSVSPATVHGGPFPATGHPGYTAVGMPTAIHRFAALRCYDRVREQSLPPELRNENPTSQMLREIDGVWTTQDAATT